MGENPGLWKEECCYIGILSINNTVNHSSEIKAKRNINNLIPPNVSYTKCNIIE